MLSMSLPWFNARYGDEVRAAEARLAADRNALSSVRRTARYELYEATERLKAARESLAILERDLVPQAERSFEAAQAAYRGGQGESLALFRSLEALLDLRLERERAIAGMASAIADVERAAGRPAPSDTSATARGDRP
jgi:outer membrane protein TolC